MNRTRYPGLLMVVLITLLTSHISLADEHDDNPRRTIVPDPVVQAQFKKAALKLRERDPEDEFAFFREMLPLIDSSGKGPEIVRQALYFDRQPTNIAESMMIFMVIHYGRISKINMVQAIAPLIGTTDPKLQKGLREVTGLVVGRPIQGLVNYTHFRSYLRGRKQAGEELELPLIEMLYRLSPGQALLTMMDVFVTGEQRQAVLWSEHVVADTLWKQKHGFIAKDQPEEKAVEQLQNMSQSEHWWVRLYVAEIMHQHPEFRDPKMIERLTRDDHPLVRKAMRFDVDGGKSSRRKLYTG